MQVIVNGRVVGALTPSEWRSAGGARPFAPTSGRVLTATEAVHSYERQMAMNSLALAGISWITAIGALLSGAAPTWSALSGLMILIAVAGTAAAAAMYRIKMAAWRRRISQRGAAEPRQNLSLVVNAAGLSLGDRFGSWKEIALAAVEFQKLPTGERDYSYTVTCVHLNGALGDLTLEATLLENGQAIVNAVFRRLYPAPPKGAGWFG